MLSVILCIEEKSFSFYILHRDIYLGLAANDSPGNMAACSLAHSTESLFSLQICTVFAAQ